MVRTDQQRHQPDIFVAGHGQQYNRQIAGKRLSPQTGLPATVGGDRLCIAAHFLTGKNQRPRQTVKQPGIIFRGIKLAQHDLTVRPGDFKYPVSNMMVAIFFQQHQALQARVADAVNHVDNHRHTGSEPDALTNRHHRIQHRTGTVTECSALLHCLRTGGGVATPDKGRAIGFK